MDENDKQVRDLRLENKRMKSEIDRHKIENKEMKSDIDLYKSDIDRHKSDIDRHKIENKEMKSDIDLRSYKSESVNLDRCLAPVTLPSPHIQPIVDPKPDQAMCSLQ